MLLFLRCTLVVLSLPLKRPISCAVVEFGGVEWPVGLDYVVLWYVLMGGCVPLPLIVRSAIEFKSDHSPDEARDTGLEFWRS